MRTLFLGLVLSVCLFGQVTKNIVTDFGATCNNMANDGNAFLAFRDWGVTWQATHTGLITLEIPQGAVCRSVGASANTFVLGLKQVKVVGLGTGATINDANGAGGIWLGGKGIYGIAGFTARLATVIAGSTSVTFLDQTKTSLFTVGTWALMAGLDLQGYGYPINQHYFEYVQITGISGAVVTFAAPLVNTYKSTWPNYNPGDNSGPDQGGPATLYALQPEWNTEVEISNITLTDVNQIYSPGRSITYRNVIVTEANCIVPTQNKNYSIIDSTLTTCRMEADKLVDVFTVSNTTLSQIDFQSSSINTLNMDHSTVTSGLAGTPKASNITDSTLHQLSPGATAYGRTDSVSCLRCAIDTMLFSGVFDTGSLGGPLDPGVQSVYGFTSNTITAVNGLPLRWAIPGTQAYWTSRWQNQGYVFVVNDVTFDGTTTTVSVRPLSGLPNIQLSGGVYFLHVLPTASFTCDCTVSADAIDMSQRPGLPMFSYSKRTYSANITVPNVGPSVKVWGRVVSIKINVTKAYTGSQSTLTLSALGTVPVQLADTTSALLYSPVINLKVAGERVITPGAITGQQSGDSALSMPSAGWMTQNFQPNISHNISAEDSSVWPSLTIEVITDQNRLSLGVIQ